MRLKKLKQKVFYNPTIRFLILNFLKLNFASTVILAASLQRSRTEFIFAIFTFVSLNSMPILFFCILRRHQDTLTDEDKINSFGTLYAGRNVTNEAHKVHFLPLAFFYRRTIFVLVTVHFFDHPGLQLISC